MDDKAIRERLVHLGAAALSDAELLSIVLREGHGGASAVQLAQKLLDESGNDAGVGASGTINNGANGTRDTNGLAALAAKPLRNLRMLGGIGLARAAALAATFEIARRVAAQNAAQNALHRASQPPPQMYTQSTTQAGHGTAQPLTQATNTMQSASQNARAYRQITNSAEVGDMFRPKIAKLPHEEFWVLYLSAANTVLGSEKAGQGGVAGVTVDHRLLVKRAVELLASGVVLVHNHPSGVAEPSKGDHDVTARIAQAAQLFDIEVVDHIIITENNSFSFRQAGLM